MRLGQPRHGHHSLDAQQRGQGDRLAHILGVLLAHLRVGMKRVAVAIESGERDPLRREERHVLVAGVLTGAHLRHRQMRRR